MTGSNKKTPANSSKLKVEKTRTRRKSYTMDLRIHSPASLGYIGVEGIDTAPAVVRLAKVKGLDVIAVTDFYSGSFVDEMIDAAKDSTLTVIPGVVIRCSLGGCDDVILLCLFPEEFRKDRIEKFLTDLDIPKSAFGNKEFLTATPFDQVLDSVDELGGVAIPSRMDKTPYRRSIIPTLVEEYGFRAFDVALPDNAEIFKKDWPKIKFQIFSFSNAQALAQVGSRIATVKMPAPGFEGIRDIVARA